MPITRCNSAGFQILLGLALLVASIAMLSPKVPGPMLFGWEDKLWHLLTFAVLAFLADAGWPTRGFTALKYLPLFAYGVAIELLQYSIPNRHFGVDDILADGAGLLLYGLLILPLLRRWAIR
jgi:hypothetical protein